MALSKVSKFYLACRNNDINEVKRMITSMSADEINRLEETSFGMSTALHAAAYYGYHEVADILLTHKADPTIRNFTGLTPYEEATTRDVACVFRRHLTKDNTPNSRFSQANPNREWISCDPDMIKRAPHYDTWLETGCRNMPFIVADNLRDDSELTKELKNDPNIDEVWKLFKEAIETHDPKRIVKAYTLETRFYGLLNMHLADTSAEMLNETFIFDPKIQPFWQTYGRLAAIIARHPDLQKYQADGLCFRGMILSTDELLQYKVGKRILTKTFSSCSRHSSVAEDFATKDLDLESDRYPIICEYNIISKRSALKLEDLSAYPAEKEVLIVPFCVFEIVKVKTKTNWSAEDGTVKIKEGRKITLKECEKQHSICSIM
ncbi:unnamed protein product [Rotaria socialis]|uniref:NAD(P)(+)--arginine ADP-ribosyltransferase n=1 Tax=Rotaria socialis TaxID=392032 RepID=A0A818BQB5_9BILA|nr:unnamed protein product [Rotaria socialis]CAF4572054.1 unnamed protein product [Rotaria socialis]